MTTDAEKEANTAKLVSPHGALVIAPFTSNDPERRVQRTIANIHAVARQLLGVRPESESIDFDDLFVGVRPSGNSWRVQVEYAGFELNVVEPTLTEALEGTLAKLMIHVGRQLDEGTRLLAALKPNQHHNHATRGAIEEAVKRVPGVAGVVLEEPENEPGLVIVYVTPERMMTIEDHTQFAAEVGGALALSLAMLVRFRVKVLGLVSA